MDDFYGDDEERKLDYPELKKKGSGWSSSVENVLNRSSKKDRTASLVAKDLKAIPGGRYGCA